MIIALIVLPVIARVIEAAVRVGQTTTTTFGPSAIYGFQVTPQLSELFTLGNAGQPSGTWMNLPCAGRLHIPSCDVSCMIATPHFARFSLANLSVEMAGMDRAIYHVDGKGVANLFATLRRALRPTLADTAAAW